VEGGGVLRNVGDFAEKEYHTKDIPMIYINFIVIKSFEKEKKGGFTFVPPLITPKIAGIGLTCCRFCKLNG
jgi:hypothetical protein